MVFSSTTLKHSLKQEINTLASLKEVSLTTQNQSHQSTINDKNHQQNHIIHVFALEAGLSK
jgi:hypothetical protein